MKILLVDDGVGKYGAFLDGLKRRFGDQVSVEHAESKVDALRALKQNCFSVLITDVYLPVRQTDPPSPTGGFDLLESLKNSPQILSPWLTVVVTKERDIRGDDQPEVFVVEDEVEENYLEIFDRIERVVELEKGLALRPRSQRCDFLWVTTLDKEYEAAKVLLGDVAASEVPVGCQKCVSAQLRGDEVEFSVILVQLRDPGIAASANGVTGAIGIYAPTAIVLSGICAGVEGESKIGDVVIASSVVDYSRGKLVVYEGRSVFEPESPTFSTSWDTSLASSKISEVKDRFQRFADWRSMVRPEEPTDLCVGIVASGNQVVGDKSIIKKLQQERFRKLKGLEMEALGAAVASREGYFGAGGVCKFYMVKGVSDLADAAKGDKYHDYCSLASAVVVKDLIVNELI